MRNGVWSAERCSTLSAWRDETSAPHYFASEMQATVPGERRLTLWCAKGRFRFRLLSTSHLAQRHHINDSPSLAFLSRLYSYTERAPIWRQTYEPSPWLTLRIHLSFRSSSFHAQTPTPIIKVRRHAIPCHLAFRCRPERRPPARPVLPTER